MLFKFIWVGKGGGGGGVQNNPSKYGKLRLFKDSAYNCYCAYALRIARCSGFLWVPTNIGVFLRGLKLCGESRT